MRPMATGTTWKSPLHQMTQTTSTCLWNDSADVDELRWAMEHGAVGATCNPVIAPHGLEVAPRGMASAHRGTRARDALGNRRRDRVGSGRAAVCRRGGAVDARLRARTTAEMGDSRSRPTRGSIATLTLLSRQAQRFDRLAPNMIVKIPATTAGIAAIEEATASRHQHQRDRLLYAAAVRSGGRSRGARPEPPRD